MTAPSDSIKDAWASDLLVEISDELWVKSLASITSCSINSRLQFIQFKVVHVLHLPETRRFLVQFNSNVDDRRFNSDNLLIILVCSEFSLTLPTAGADAWFGLVVAKRVILKKWKCAAFKNALKMAH